MKALSILDIAKAVGAQTVLDCMVESVCTDSRKLQPGCLFIALSGENFDGHEYTGAALEKGAAAVLCERETGCGDKEILVDDTHLALLHLAAYYRRLFELPVIGITGSVGKTTTKEMTAAVISRKYKTLKNEGNRNNEIGLPLTLFNLDGSYEAAVLEMGMSGFREIASLSRTAEPSLGIITNIGVSHMEKLGSRENILKAKMEILEGMRDDAPLLLNGDDALIFHAETGNHQVSYFGIENDACRFKAYGIEQKNGATEFIIGYDGVEQKTVIPAVGKHNIYNALAAFGAGILMGVPPLDVAAALNEYKPSGMRQRIKNAKGITFIEDCYNASPDSVRAALSVLGGLPAQRKIAVLGDMLELGDLSGQAHAESGICAAENGIDILLTYGVRSVETANKARDNGIKTVRSFTDKRELALFLSSVLLPEDAVLFKASRGMGLEDTIKIVYGELKIDE